MPRGARSNPYTPDAGARPPELAGRDAEREHFRLLLERLSDGRTERSLIVTGMRGVGKTVLLNEFEDIAADKEWLSEMMELQHRAEFGPKLARALRRLLIQMSAKERMKQRATLALRVLKSFTATIGGVEFKLDVDAAVGVADSGDLAEDLRDLFLHVGETARSGKTGVVILCDELQLLNLREYEAVVMALHRVKQKGVPVAFVGAGLPMLPELTGDAKTYAERQFEFPRIGALPPDEAKRALAVPAKKQNVVYEPEALDLIIERSGAYPYFLQEYGKHVWNIATRSPITREEVISADPVVLAYLDENFFEIRIGRLTDRQQDYLRAMASAGTAPTVPGRSQSRCLAKSISAGPEQETSSCHSTSSTARTGDSSTSRFRIARTS